MAQGSKNDNLSGHILPTSATMVGVCMTVISIVRLAHPGGFGRLIDKMLAGGSILFLVSVICSFVSMRLASRSDKLEKWAEYLFIAGLGILAVASVLLSFEIL